MSYIYHRNSISFGKIIAMITFHLENLFDKIIYWKTYLIPWDYKIICANGIIKLSGRYNQFVSILIQLVLMKLKTPLKGRPFADSETI